jgi:hypothetical protein
LNTSVNLPPEGQTNNQANNFAFTMLGLFTLNDGTRIAVKKDVIDEKEHAYPQTALQAFPWRLDPGCEFVHEEQQGDRCDGGRPFGQWQSARTKQRSLPSGAGLLVKIGSTTPK